MNNVMVIDGKPVEIIEYKGYKVITTKVMAEHHGLDVKVMNQKFKRNRKYFNEGKDYFAITTMEAQNMGIHVGVMNRADIMHLYTPSGYLKMLKTINDDVAWGIFADMINAINDPGSLFDLMRGKTNDTRDRSGYIYCALYDNNTVKIGMSSTTKRHEGLRNSSAAALLKWEYYHTKDRYIAEMDAHAYFNDNRLHGEFFNIEYEEVKNYLEKITT